jgi:dephospho-CoA kinase
MLLQLQKPKDKTLLKPRFISGLFYFLSKVLPMLRVALTGGIGSGKSEASQIFAELGATVVDSDQLSRDVIERGTQGFDEVIQTFGDEILTGGEIDRAKLATVVFSDPTKRSILEGIIHPKVREAFEVIAEASGSNDILINQIPLLVETNGEKSFDKVITVSAPVELRKTRLIKRGMKEYEVDKRIAAQASDEERAAIADYIIDNSGDRSGLLSQVEKIYEDLTKYASNN